MPSCPPDPVRVFVLPAAGRLRRGDAFRAVMRHGVSAGGRHLVVHLLVDGADSARPAQVGFVTTRKVGSAVTRNRLRRQLRHVLAVRRADLPTGAQVVVRVRPGAAGASSACLAEEVDQLLRRTQRRRQTPGRVVGAVR